MRDNEYFEYDDDSIQEDISYEREHGSEAYGGHEPARNAVDRFLESGKTKLPLRQLQKIAGE